MPNPHYQLGQPYQSNGNWFYPAENYAFDQSGLASVYRSGHASLTSNGEKFDGAVATLGHPTLQLPAIARITNLENGYSMLVRINDRGEGSTTRFVQVTGRVATLLRMRDPTAAPVRVRLLGPESKDAMTAVSGAPKLDIDVAPIAPITVASLPPPGMPTAHNVVQPAALQRTDPPSVPAIERLSEDVIREATGPVRLWVRLDTFELYRYAEQQERKMRYYKTAIEETFENRARRFTVKIGPFDTVREADDTVRSAFAVGIPDARIVVE